MSEIDVTKCQEYGYELDGKHKCFCRPELMNGEVMGYEDCEDIPLEECYYKQLIQKEQKLEKIREIVKFNMKVSCGEDCSKKNCICRNKEILNIIESEE